MSTLDELHALPTPSGPGVYSLGGLVCAGCRLAVTHERFLALLIDVERTGTSTPRRLENVLYLPPHALEVVGAATGKRVEHLAVLVCRSSEPELESMFLRLAKALLDGGPRKLSEADLESRIDELVTLVRALSQPGRLTIQGLWCELAIVAWSRDPKQTLASWHSSSRALFDFEQGPDRLEVKSCATGLREHTIRLDQLQEAPGGRTLIASLTVQETEDGESVEDLCDLIRKRVWGDVELTRRLETVVAQSLGDQWREVASRRYSLQAARQSLRVYPAACVPSVSRAIPAEVSNVQFVVDLSTTDAVSLEAARSLAPFFDHVLPGDD